jgi:uncharacterized membrane protein
MTDPTPADADAAEDRGESRLPATLAILAALVLYATLPDPLTLGPGWVIPVLEIALIIPLMIRAPYRHPSEGRMVRNASLLLIALVNIANLGSLLLLLSEILSSGDLDGRTLILSSMRIWLTMVLVFALWYWELDGGGPSARGRKGERQPDFLFPQLATSELQQMDWEPRFIDYLYVSFTNATAFSPTDTMPLTRWAKVLMLAEALASITTIVMIAGRAVNILR